MSRSFKVSFVDVVSGNREVFAVKLNSESLENLREEVFARKPNARDKILSFSYEDSDGDRIAVVKDSDFDIFLEQDINKIFAEAKAEASVWQPLNQSVPSVYNDEIRSIYHEGILCDICDKEIYGFRYKCMDCEEFDMCMDCEPRQIHKEHLLLRITNPIDGDKTFELHYVDDDNDEDEDDEDSDDH